MIRIDFELKNNSASRWLKTENKERRERLEGAIATFLPFIYKLLLYCYRSTINKCLSIVYSITV